MTPIPDGSRLAAPFFLEFLNAFVGRSELPQQFLHGALLGGEQLEETIGTDPSLLHILPQCFDFDSAHACYRSKTAAHQLRQFFRIFKNFGGVSKAISPHAAVANQASIPGIQ
jgi:hypothetical protein